MGQMIDIPICVSCDDEIKTVVFELKQALPYLEENDLYLNLDMDVLPEVQKKILDVVNSDRVNIVYNIGLMMYLGYDNDEFLDLLFDRIRNVVIYNCGTGGEPRNIDLSRFQYQFEELNKRGYKYNYRIQNTHYTREKIGVYMEVLDKIWC